MADLELEPTRRDLIAMRVRHGADSPVGHRCSNLIGQLESLQDATSKDQRRALERAIEKSMADLKRLTSRQ